MERERILEEVAKIEAFIASYHFENGAVAFATGMTCFRAKTIRSVCIRRGIRRDIRPQGKRFKDATTKDAYIAALWEDCTLHGSSPRGSTCINNNTTKRTTTQDPSSPRDARTQITALDSSNSLLRPMQQTKHCIIRLLNVLFSSRFTGRLTEIRTTSEREDADDIRFWEDVSVAYFSALPEFHTLISPRVCFRKLNPSTVRPHAPTKLRDMWNMLCVAYRAAHERVMMSEEHAGWNFGDVYTGRLDVRYLHEWLLLRPEHVSTVGLEVLDRAQENYVEPESSPSTPSEATSRDIQTIDTLSAAETQIDGTQMASNSQPPSEDVSSVGRQVEVTQTIVETQQDAEVQTLKRKMTLLENITDILHWDLPDETEIKRRKLKESSEYVQSLFRTVEVMRSAGCSLSVLTEMMQETSSRALFVHRCNSVAIP